MRKIICLFLLLSLTFMHACKKQEQKSSVTSCKLVLEYIDNAIMGSVCYKYLLPDNDIQKIYFNLFAKTLSNNEEDFYIKNLTVDKITCQWEYQGAKNQFLCVSLNEKKSAGKEVEIYIEFYCRLNENDKKLGISNSVVNLAFFYPILCIYEDGEYLLQSHVDFGDDIFCGFYNFDILLTIPSVYTFASGATVGGIEVKGEKTVYLASLKNARVFAFSLSENFHVVSKKWGNKRVNYYYVNDNSPENTLNFIIDTLEYFSQKIAKYPYENFSIVQSDYYISGVAYSAFCVVKSNLTKNQLERTIAHEIVHQWFSVGVALNEFNSAYFDEGIVEYLTEWYFSENKKTNFENRVKYSNALFNAYLTERMKTQKEYKSIMKKPLDKFADEKEYYFLCYEKSFLFFNHLNKLLNGKLINYLSSFYKKNFFKVVSEEDFYRVFNTKSKKVKGEFEKFVFTGSNEFVA